jgi:Domain of unknown function (DUF4190)/Domain of unknown function (DUF1707)
MRATDADRETVRTILEDAHAEGRLSWEDFDTRSTALVSAKTYDQLSTLTADLPSRIPAVPPLVYDPGAGYQEAPLNGLAIASFSLGLSQIFFWFLTGIPAIITGHIARQQIKRRGEQGAGFALAGLALGYAGLGLAVVVGLIITLIVVAATSPAHH